MNANQLIITIFLFEFLCRTTRAESTVIKLSLPPPAFVTRADVYVAATASQPKAVLVLCPGMNGEGRSLVEKNAWQDFARKQNLGLVGISFASNSGDLHDSRGYFYAAQGSGETLLGAIRKIYGREMPLILYGFSGGAHFTSRFVAWKPDRVVTWCAYSAAWWDDPRHNGKRLPPGIIACGDLDPRMGASLMFLKQGRAVGNQWLWINVVNNGHTPSDTVEDFVRAYFARMLNPKHINGLWVDIDTERAVSIADASRQPSLTAWLPDRDLLSKWRELNEP